MYRLYGSARNRAGRVMWMLEELGATYEFVPCSPHDPVVAALNPTGKVPVLVDDDLVVCDSTAILLHLADKHGKLTFPVNTPERTKLMSVVAFALDDVEQPLWTAAKHGFVLPEELRALDAVLPALHHDWNKAMAALEKMIGEGPYVMGETFTVADVILGHLSVWGKNARFPAPPAAVAAYFQRIQSRPGWQAVIKAREAA